MQNAPSLSLAGLRRGGPSQRPGRRQARGWAGWHLAGQPVRAWRAASPGHLRQLPAPAAGLSLRAALRRAAQDEDGQEAEGEDGPGIWIPEGVESDSEEEDAAAAASDSSSEGAAAGGSDEEAGAAGPSSGGEDEAMAEAERPPQQVQRAQRAQRGKKAAAAGQAQQEGTKAGEAGGRGRGKRGAGKQGAAPKEAALAAEEPNGTKAPSTK